MILDFRECRINSNGELCIKPLDFTALLSFLDKHNPGKNYTCEIKEKRKKRSKNANDYFWALCSLLAEERSKDGDRVTKNEVYIEQIKQVGVYEDITINADGVESLTKIWNGYGTGWVCEIVDMIPGQWWARVRCYHGSSTYDSKEMSRLIDGIVQDCEAVGIETMPPEKLAALLQDWRAEK